MGIFSTKKVTHVATSVSRVIDDQLIPDAIQTGMLKSVVNDGDINDYIMEEYISNIGIKAEQLYRYAQGSYTNGMPSGQYYLSTQGKEIVEALLERLEGNSIALEYIQFGPMNPYHAAFTKLMQSHGYDPVTNKLGSVSTPTEPAYLTEISLVIPPALINDYSEELTQYWDIPVVTRNVPSRLIGFNNLSRIAKQLGVVIDESISVPYIRIGYIVEVPIYSPYSNEQFTNIETKSFNLVMPVIDSNVDYFQAKYVVNGITRYVDYRYGSNVYPELEAIFNTPAEESGTFFPFAYFRYNKASTTTDTNTQEYTTTKKMLKYINMDYVDVAESINANIDIEHVEQAILMLSVPADTDNLLEQRYLFEFFNNLYYANLNTLDKEVARVQATLFNDVADLSKFVIVIKDNKFKMAVSASNIIKSVKIGNIGTYAHTYSTRNRIEHYLENTGESGSFVTAEATRTVIDKIHTYQKQISPEHYEEVEVFNLQTTFYVWGEYTTIGDEVDDILLIPLDHSITKEYKILEREELYSRSLHIVFNSRVIEKIKWYQQGLFKGLLVAAALVIAISSVGTQSQWLIAAVAAGEYVIAMQIVLILIEQYITALLVSAGLTLFVKEVGLDTAFIIAAVFIAYGAYNKINLFGSGRMLWADEILSLGNGLIKSVNTVSKDLIGELLEERTAFEKETEAALETLRNVQEELYGDNRRVPLILPYETATQYMQRMSYGSTMGPDAVHNHVAITMKQLTSIRLV